MKLSKEEVERIKTQIEDDGMDCYIGLIKAYNLIETIESLQQENEDWKEAGTIASNHNKKLKQEIEQKDKALEQAREGLTSIYEYWNRDSNYKAMEDACYENISTAETTLCMIDMRLKGLSICDDLRYSLISKPQVNGNNGSLTAIDKALGGNGENG